MDAERSLNNSYRTFTAANKRKHLPTGRRSIEVAEDFKAWLFLQVWLNEHKKSSFEGPFEVDGNEIDSNPQSLSGYFWSAANCSFPVLTRQVPLGYWLKCEVKMAGYWLSSFFCVFKDRDGVEVHKLEKAWSIKDLLYPWLSWKFFLLDTAGSPG